MRTILALALLCACARPVAAADPPAKLDRYGDPLPEGAIMRLGTLRGSANVQSFGVAADGSVLTVGSEGDLRLWLPTEASSEPVVQLPLKVPDNWPLIP